MTKELEKSLEVLRRQKPYLHEAYGVNAIGVFGSFARGKQDQRRKRSDIDIMVELDERAHVGFFKFFELEEYLRRRLKRKVDLVTKDAIKPATEKNIFKDMIYV